MPRPTKRAKTEMEPAIQMNNILSFPPHVLTLILQLTLEKGDSYQSKQVENIALSCMRFYSVIMSLFPLRRIFDRMDLWFDQQDLKQWEARFRLRRSKQDAALNTQVFDEGVYIVKKFHLDIPTLNESHYAAIIKTFPKVVTHNLRINMVDVFDRDGSSSTLQSGIVFSYLSKILDAKNITLLEIGYPMAHSNSGKSGLWKNFVRCLVLTFPNVTKVRFLSINTQEIKILKEFRKFPLLHSISFRGIVYSKQEDLFNTLMECCKKPNMTSISFGGPLVCMIDNSRQTPISDNLSFNGLGSLVFKYDNIKDVTAFKIPSKDTPVKTVWKSNINQEQGFLATVNAHMGHRFRIGGARNYNYR